MYDPQVPKVARTIYAAFVLLLFLSSGVLVIYLFTPYEWVKKVLDSLPRDRDLELYTPDFERRAKHYLQMVVIGMALGTLFFWRRRDTVLRSLNEGWSGLTRYAGEQFGYIRKFFREESRFHKTALLIVLIFGLLIRLIYLINQPINHDEARTVYDFAHESFAELLTNYGVPNNHIFLSFLIKISIFLFGNHVWSIRLSVFLAGVFVLVMTYITCRVLLGRQIALLSTALCAVSYPLVQYSSNARGYMLVIFFFLCLLYLGEQIKSSDNRVAEKLFALCAGLGAWTIPVMLYPFTIAVLWLFVSPNRSRMDIINSAVRISIFTGIFVGIVYGPMLLRMGPAALTSDQNVAPKDWSFLWPDFVDMLTILNDSLHRSMPKEVQFFLFSLAILGLVFPHARQRTAIRLAFVSLIPSILWIVLQRRIAFARVWLFLIPVYFFLIATGISVVLHEIRKVERLSTVSVAVVCAALVALFLRGTIRGITYPMKVGGSCTAALEVVAFLAPQLDENTVLETATPCSGPIRYYLNIANVSLDHFYWNRGKSANAASLQKFDQIFLVMMEPRHDFDFFNYGRRIRNYGPPRLVKKFPDLKIYRMDRIESSDD